MSQRSFSQKRHRFATTLATLSLSAAVALASANAVAQQPEHAHSADHSTGHGQQVAATNPAAQRKAAIDSTEALINSHKQWAQARGVSNKAVALENLIAKTEARRELMAELIRTNPAEALRVAIPDEKQAGMPAEVQAMLEQRFEVEGELVALYTDFEDGSHKLSHSLKTPFGESFELHLADKNRNFVTGTQVSVSGLLLEGDTEQGGNDGDIAVSANPEDILTLSVDGGTSGGSNGGSIHDTAGTVGELKVLAIMVNFQDNPNDTRISTSDLQTNFEQVNQFIQENSYGQATVSADITGNYTIPLSSTSCVSDDIAYHADQAAIQAGVNIAGYDRLMYILAPNSGCNFRGKGTVGGIPSRSWINDPYYGVLAHELGHNMGLLHSNTRPCMSGVLSGGECQHNEYGNIFDKMGTGAGHFNAYQKERLGWLGTRLLTVTQSGAYDLSAYEFDGPNPLALKILKGIDSVTGFETWYYLESRKLQGEDRYAIDGNSHNGILVHTGENRLKNTNYLLDMTPETIGNLWDSALEQGYSYSDQDAGITLTAAGVDQNGAQVDITLKGGTLTCKRANPTVSLSPGQSPWIPAGTSTSFSVTVTNKDSSICSNSSFNLGKSLPSGWNGSFNNSSLTLAPGASATTTLTVTSANTASDGFYTIGVNASNGNYNASGDVTYVVDNSIGNSAPVANNDSASTEAGNSISIPVLNNDSDPDGDSLTITATAGVTGSAVVNNGAITFTPAAGFSGTENFTYTISDGRGGSDSAIVSVTVSEGTASNSAPVAGNDSASTDAGIAVTIPVLNNDSDADGDSLTVTSFNGVNGSAVINNNGTITFTPANGFSGTETFSYVVSDGNGGTDSASVTVTVNAAPVDTNNAPIAVNDSVMMPTVTTTKIAVLANDNDPEGDALKVVSVTKAAKGTVVINTDGTISYIPGNRFKNADSFSYTISDGAKTATATVSVQLQKNTGGSGGKGNGKNK